MTFVILTEIFMAFEGTKRYFAAIAIVYCDTTIDIDEFIFIEREEEER